MGSRGVGRDALVRPGRANGAKNTGLQIIFEGGHPGNQHHKQGLKLLLDRCSASGRKIQVVMGFGRNLAARTFLDRLAEGADAFLLIDSEGPWSPQSVSELAGVDLAPHEDRVFFMVQVMESWFIADSNALKGIKNANLSLLDEELRKQNGKIEAISKARVSDLFTKATSPHVCSTDNGKGLRLSYLANLDPEKLRTASPEADRLIRTAENSWVPLPKPPAESQKAPDLDDVAE